MFYVTHVKVQTACRVVWGKWYCSIRDLEMFQSVCEVFDADALLLAVVLNVLSLLRHVLVCLLHQEKETVMLNSK